MHHLELAEIKLTLERHDLLKKHSGGNPHILDIKAVENCGPGDLVFASSPEFAQTVIQRSPAAVVTSTKCSAQFEACQDLAVLEVSNVKLAHAILKQSYAGRDYRDDQWPRIHPSAVIHESVHIPVTSFIGPGVVIGKEVKMGSDCHILAGVVIEHGASLGDRCIVHPNAVIGYECNLGDDVEIGSGTVIGSEGFGFAQDDQGRSYKIPQTGIVVIEDRVQLGAANCIDRATYGITRIGSGTKSDNICHFAHNVEIGKDCLFTPMICVAGSTKIGDRVISSGQTQVSDHITICDDVFLVHRAGVTQDITEPGWYAGMPTQPFKEYMKNIAQFRKLSDIKNRLMDLSKKFRELL